MKDLDTVFAALANSAFRSRMRLAAPDRAYLQARGLPVVLAHARDFVGRRLAPAAPRQDGRQTPMRGHPVSRPNTRRQPAAGAAWRHGTVFPPGRR